MSDKDFVVKNGLVVNTTFTANSTEVHIGNATVNAVFTSPNTNVLTLTLSNSSVTGTLTSANYSGTAANSQLLNNQPGSYYTNATNINAGTLAWAYQAANTVNTTGNFTMTGNLNFTATNNYFGNSSVSPTIYVNTINSTANGVTVNNSLITIGNSSVNVQINSTTISATANNALNLGGQPPSYYTNASNINAGTLPWAYQALNTVNTTGVFTMANLTVNSTFTVTNGSVATVSNSSGLYALSGNVKTSYLETTALANLAWANISGNVYIGGNVYVSGNFTATGSATIVNTVSISTKDHTIILADGSTSATAADASGIVVANTDATTGALGTTYANFLYNAANNAWMPSINVVPQTTDVQSLGSATQLWHNLYGNNIYGTLQTNSQPNIVAGDSLKLGGVLAAFYVQNTDSRVLSGNLNFTGSNVFFGNATLQGAVYFGNSSVTNTIVNASAITLGGTGTSLGNVSVSYSGFIAGNTTVASNAVLLISNTSGVTRVGANGASIGGNTLQVGTTLYVTLAGNTGYGTSTPAAFVEIDSPFGTTTSNNLFLYQNSATVTSATWNSYRYITTGSANTTAYQFRQFNVGPGGIGIGYAPPTSARAATDALYVAGNTGFNTQTPGALVDINGTLNVSGMSNIGGPISVNGDVSVGWSNGVINSIFTSTGATTPYWSSNAFLNVVNAVSIGSNTVTTVTPPATFTFSGNATALTGNVSIYSATAWTGSVTAGAGTITIPSGTASVTGSGTQFTNYIPGTVISLTNNANTALNTYYAIKSITNNTFMTLNSIVPAPGATSVSFWTGGLDLRNRLFVPGIANLLQTGDKVVYNVGVNNTAITGLTNATTYSVLWGNATSIALANPTIDALSPVSLLAVTATPQPGHSLTINYQSSVSISNNGAGAAVIVVGNSTVNTVVNSSAFSGNAYNITQFPLNQSVNTSGSPTFANITSSTSMRIGGSSSGSTLYFGTTAATTANLSWSTGGGVDTLNFGSSQGAVMTINGTATVLTSCNYGTFISLAWTNITGKPTNVSYWTNDSSYANSTNGFGINGTAAAAPWSGITGKPTAVSYWTNDNSYANSTNGAAINGNASTATLAAKASTLAANGGNGTGMTFNWSGQAGQPTWLWGGGDGVNMYVYNPSNFNVNSAVYSTQLTGSQQTNPILGSSSPLAMSGDTASRGSFIARSGGAGDNNLAGMTFWNDSYAIKLGVRNDGVFGLGGWSRPAYSWYSDASGNMVAAGNVIAYSDPKLKENITQITDAVGMIQKLDGVNFTWKEGYIHTEYKAGKKDIGVLADQVEAILPEIISDSVVVDGVSFKMVAYDKLIPVLIEAIKELKAEIDDLKSDKNKRKK
jgi:hypothetical protein